MSGTKKQKMDMSHAIVAAVYSMNPPGRFLKQCPDTGKWSELSERDAVERAAQAMGYAIRDKDDLKRKRDERRRSPRRRSSRQKSSTEADDDDDDDLAAEALSSLSAPHNLSAARASTAGDGINNTTTDSSTAAQNDRSGLSAADVMGMPLPPSSQLHQPSNAINHHPTSTNQYLNQWIQEVLAQAAQHQQQQQQILQNYNLGQNPLGQLPHSQTQTPLQPAASLDVATHQPIDQTQQLQQLIQQQQQWQNLILLQHLLNNPQNVLPSDLLATFLFSLAPSSAPLGVAPIPNANVASSNYSSTTQSHLAANNIDISHIQQQQLSNTSTALLLSGVLRNLKHQPNNIDILSAPQGEGAQQSDQLQHSLMQRRRQQQQQLLAPPLSIASNQYLGQQQQSLLSDPLYQAWMTAMLQQIQNSSQAPPSINAQPSSANAEADAAPPSTRQEYSEDEQQSVSEEQTK